MLIIEYWVFRIRYSVLCLWYWELGGVYWVLAPKGEVVVLIDRGRSDSVKQVDLETDLQRALKELSMRDAVDLVAQAHGLPRRQVYQAALALGKD